MATPAARMAATRRSTASREPNETAMCAILGVSPGKFINSRRAPELSARKRDVNGRVLLTYCGPIVAPTTAGRKHMLSRDQIPMRLHARFVRLPQRFLLRLAWRRRDPQVHQCASAAFRERPR